MAITARGYQLRWSRRPVTSVRFATRIAVGGLVGLAWVFGWGIAHANADQEKEACQLMDDPSAAESGYAPVEYAFMMLRAKMSAQNARDVISLAAQDFCPNRLNDLPASWR